MRTEDQKRQGREQTRRWREANRERDKELGRAFYTRNRERILARMKARRQALPELFRAKAKRQYAKRKDSQPSPYHGLSRAQIRTRLAAQGGACAVCSRTTAHRWCGDHDHITGAFRGVLCHGCNSGIGLLGDTEPRVRAAADYLARHAQLQAML